MNQQNVILKTQTKVQDFEVIGHGGMIDEPCQIGEWWVMPADQYTGRIPEDIQAKWDNFKALNIPVLGYLIADDMRDVLLKRAQQAEEALERERMAEQERQQQLLQQQRQQAEIKRLDEERRQEEARQMEHDRQREAERQALIRRQQAEKEAAEAAKAALAVVGGIAGLAVVAVGGLAVLAIGAALAILRFDPILIAVLPDGRWVCLGAWWD